MAGLFFLWFGIFAFPVQADDLPALQVGHIYVSYSSAKVPDSSGTLVDITTSLNYVQEHVYDCFGNPLNIDTVNNTVTDSSARVVGFIYYEHD